MLPYSGPAARRWATRRADRMRIVYRTSDVGRLASDAEVLACAMFPL